jgi:predicted MFS family arabinose efflux permease
MSVPVAMTLNYSHGICVYATVANANRFALVRSRAVNPHQAAPADRRAFALLAVAYGLAMFASAAPSPLYPIYQQRWQFSAAMLTVVFAVYVAGLLASLLTLGSLSDHIGRRPVLVGSLLALVGAMAIFATAGSVAALIVARLIQGLATGAALSALSAALADTQPSRRAGSLVLSIAPIAGLGFGVLGSALLVQYGPNPRQLVYEVLAAAQVLTVVAVLTVVPDNSPRAGFSSPADLIRVMVPKVSVPHEVRAAFIAGVPALVAVWALGGLILSLGSSIISAQLGISNLALGGLLLGGFFFIAALAAPRASHSTRPLRLPASYACLAAGLGLQLAGSLSGTAAVYTVGLVIAGVGFSTAYVGVIASLAHVPAAQRGQLFAALYVVCYLAFSLPALAGGIAADDYGLHATTTGYTVFDLAMVALAAAFIIRDQALRQSATGTAAAVADADCADCPQT